MKWNSAIYEGVVVHRRVTPAKHRFQYPLFMMYLDLDELPELFDGHLLWSARRPALAWYRRADYLAPVEAPLDEAVRDRLEAKLGARPRGPIRLLTHLRYYGYVFNPVSFYYAFEPAGRRAESVLAEITNTPWGERHTYAVPLDDNRTAHDLRKEFHVSPFMPMDVDYGWSFSQPGRSLEVRMENRRRGDKFFTATLAMKRYELSRRTLTRALLRYPFMTLRVMAAIHLQALNLWRKRVPFHPHPAKLKVR